MSICSDLMGGTTHTYLNHEYAFEAWVCAYFTEFSASLFLCAIKTQSILESFVKKNHNIFQVMIPHIFEYLLTAVHFSGSKGASLLQDLVKVTSHISTRLDLTPCCKTIVAKAEQYRDSFYYFRVFT